MAFQRSSVKLEGAIGDLTFYKVNEEYRVKQRGGHSKERLAKDPNFERVRENLSEFGHASNLAARLKKSLKQSMGSSFELFNESSLTNRLTKRMNSILKADSISPRGERRVTAENFNLLHGFSVNSNAALKDTFFMQAAPVWLPYEGLLRLRLPAFLPAAVMEIPKTASKFRFHLCAIEITDADDAIQGISTQSSLLATHQQQEEQSLDLVITAAGMDAFLVFMGISFYSEFAGYMVPFTQPLLNALDVVKVFRQPPQ